MNTLPALEELIGKLELSPNLPASTEQMATFETTTELSLPDSVRALFSITDGLVFERAVFEFHSLGQMLNYPPSFFSCPWGFLPLGDNNDSNPWCVCCKSPLRGFVVQVFHDNAEPAIKFRSLPRFLKALTEFAQRGEWCNLRELRSDFDEDSRTDEDIRLGRECFQLAAQLTYEDRSCAVHLGLQLLSEREVEDIVPWLEDEDEYIVDATRRHLKSFRSKVAIEALRKEEAELRAFAQKCVVELSKADIKASLHDRNALRLDDGPIWINLPMFFAKRRQPDVFEKLIARSRFFLSQKQ